MAESSNIEWTDATFNPWVGCTKISPACDNCYAEDWSKRFGDVEWGNAPRRRTSEKNWNNPRRWNKQADEWEAEHGRPRFVFCASLADVFDNQVDPTWREDLWKLIKECDRLVWLLLTKRPQNIAKMLPPDWGDGYPNVWLGTTVENQEIADRNIPHLMAAPAAKRFLSIEPIVGPIDLTVAWHMESAIEGDCWGDCGWCEAGYPPLYNCMRGNQSEAEYLKGRSGIDWVITGGESGKNARPAHPDWYRQLRDQCLEADVPFHFKQWGEWIPWEDTTVPLVTSQHGQTEDRWALYPSEWDDDPNWDDGLWMISEGFESVVSQRVGKKNAGRLLDGRTWDGRPTP
ncbi:MAG: phage Gp37/Gp68 family protein [Pseudomonadota bacterium]